MSVAGLICTAVFAVIIGVWFWRQRRKRVRGAPSDSIVLLLKEPKQIDIGQLAEFFGRAAGKSVTPLVSMRQARGTDSSGPAGDVVAGASPHFIAKVSGAWYAVHNLSSPYLVDPVRASKLVREMRLSKAIRDNRAWLSVDIIHPQAATPEAYRVVARVLAHFVDSDCLALYSPTLNRFVPYQEDETAAKLQSDDPVNAIFHQGGQVPVVALDDDPRLKSAEEEARRRFSEFETAFEKKDGTKFAIKARISSDGNSEHIWIEVDQITESNIRGRLGNDPVDLAGLKMGSRVEVERGQVEDWAFLRSGAPVGLFTVAAIQQIEKERYGELPSAKPHLF